MVVEWWQNGSKTVAFCHYAGSCEDAEAVGRGRDAAAEAVDP